MYQIYFIGGHSFNLEQHLNSLKIIKLNITSMNDIFTFNWYRPVLYIFQQNPKVIVRYPEITSISKA